MSKRSPSRVKFHLPLPQLQDAAAAIALVDAARLSVTQRPPHISPANPIGAPIDPARALATLAARPRALATNVTTGSIATAREANEKGR